MSAAPLLYNSSPLGARVSDECHYGFRRFSGISTSASGAWEGLERLREDLGG